MPLHRGWVPPGPLQPEPRPPASPSPQALSWAVQSHKPWGPKQLPLCPKPSGHSLSWACRDLPDTPPGGQRDPWPLDSRPGPKAPRSQGLA